MSKFNEDINKDIRKNVHGVSCLKRFKETSKLIKGYNQFDSVPRAIGFKDMYSIQQSLHGYNHMINATHVKIVTEWLFNNGYDIIKLIKK